jgi:hypothetical protein
VTNTQPVKFIWDGEAMVPATGYWARQCDKQFVVGEAYRLAEAHERSQISHNHEFAFIAEAWNSLPDHLLEQYPSPEHLRKYALIRKGFATMVQHPCPTKAEAERLLAVLAGHVDKYAIVVRRDAVVTVYEAESQSYRSMGKKRFQESKTAIMEFIGDLLGVQPAALANVQEAA